MLDCLKKVDGKKLGVFAAGVAFGTKSEAKRS